MSQIALSYPLWLADFYLLSTVLLALALVGSALLSQPAQRLAIAKSALIALPLLAALCAVPGWSFVHLLTADEPKSIVADREVSQAPLVSMERVRPVAGTRPNVVATEPPAAHVQETPAAPKRPRQIHWQAILPVVHLIGAACIAAWLGLGWFASLRLRRTAQLAPPNAVAILNELVAAHFGRREQLQLLTHQRIDVAVALGIWRPTILLPALWCERESPEQLRTVLVHEATHVFNRDLQWVAVALLLLIALWANPLYWISRRRLRLDQEALADAAAAELTSRQQYAEQLVDWARRVGSRPTIRLSSAVGLWEGPSQLRRRIAILLNERLRVLRACSRRWRLTTLAVCALLASGLSLLTLQPGNSAPPADVEKGQLSESQAAQVDAAIQVLRETDSIGDDSEGRSDKWASQIRILAEIGSPAVPKLIKALDEETRDHPISKLAFALRAIGDSRAVPVLIRSIPRTLLRGHGGFLLYVRDSALLKFLQENDEEPGVTFPRGFSYGSAFGEVISALHKLTGTEQNESELYGVSLNTTERQRRMERKLFHELAERWETWWSKNWRRFKVAEAYAAVDLPPLREDKADLGPPADKLPAGANIMFGHGSSGYVIGMVNEIDSEPMCFLDLDTNRRGFWPKEIPAYDKLGPDKEPIMKWARERGFDIMGIKQQPPGFDAPVYCLLPIQMKVWQITRDEQKELPRAMGGEIPYPLDRPVDLMVPAMDSAEKYYGTDLGGAPYLFLTHEGTAGRLRITAQVTDTTRRRATGTVFMGQNDNYQYETFGPHRGVRVGLEFIAEVRLPQLPKGARRVPIDTPNAPPETERGQPKNSASRIVTPPTGKTEPPAEKDGAQPAPTKTEDASRDDHAPTGGVFIAASNQPGTPNTIEGQCVDQNGKPLAGVEVVVNRVWYQDASRREPVAKQTTQADGKFRFDKVVDIAKSYPDGKIPKLPDFAAPYFQVAARKSGHVSVAEGGAQNDIARQGLRQTIKMPPGATLRGRITGPKGDPAAGALVSVGFSQLDRWEGFQTVRTGPDGRYEIADAPKNDPKNQEKVYGLAVRNGEDYLTIQRAINVEHPNYASGAVLCEGIPGTQDVQLKAPAVITGRVIDGVTKQPVPKARILAMPNKTSADIGAGFAIVATDAQGKYRITTLPASKYDLWAEAPNRVNNGLKKLATSSDRETPAPDLVMTPGGTIRVRLIDGKTRQPIPLKGDERAHINVTPMPPMTAPAMVEAKNGRFEARAFPGEVRIDLVSASSNDAIKWIIRQGETVTVQVVEGKSTDVDVRVQDIADMQRSNSIGVLFSRALDERSTDERKAIADFEQIIKLDPPYPNDVGAYACLALILAESADDSVRDGKRALVLAQKARQLEDKPSAFVLDALAAAYAEVGDFDRAVANEKEAIEAAKKEPRGDPPTDYLKLYEAHKPRRDTKPPSNRPSNKASSTNQPQHARVSADSQLAPAVDAGVPMLCVDRDGKPVAGVEIHLFQFSGGKDGRYQHFGPFTSDANGRAICKQASFYDDGQFDRWVYARVPGHLVGVARSVNWKQRRSPINAEGRVVLWPSRSVEGRVSVPAGFDPKEVTVKVRTMHVFRGEKVFDFETFPREDSFVGLNTALPKIFERHPDVNGRIRFEDIPVKGRLYLVTIGKGLGEAQWWNGSRTFDKPIDLRLEKECRLPGQVLLPDGKPAAGAHVAARITSNRAAYLSTFSTTTNEKGRFEINGLPSMELVVYALDRTDDTRDKWVCRPVPHIQIASGESMEQTLRTENGGLVSGRILDPDGKPVEGASFSAIPEIGDDAGLDHASSKADGRYQFRLPAGIARLYFDALPDGFAYPEPQIVKELNIKPGQKPIENLDFTLPRKKKL